MNEPQPPTFFVDWCFGKTIVAALHKAGAKVEHHGDHFAPETPDTLWLPTVGQRGWIVLTKDKRIGTTLLESSAIAQGKTCVFTLVSGNLCRQEMADFLVHALPKLETFWHQYPAPFIAKLYKDGALKLWRNADQLQSLLSSK